VLVSLIGAQAKCKLLYDLAESYSETCLHGVLQLRNPLNSSERVWASIVDVPNGEHKYLLPPFLSKETELEMHNLKCSVKFCGDNFNIKLGHCNPYAMISGRQKKNVVKAIEFIKKSINVSARNGGLSRCGFVSK
jgi:hypothetical protein